MAPKSMLSHITREQLAPVWLRKEIPVRKIAEALGCPPAAVTRRARALGLPERGRHQTGKKKLSDAEFAALWNAGVIAKDIQKVGGYASEQTVTGRAAWMGLPRRERGHAHRRWANTITIEEYHEQQLAARMAEAAGGRKIRAAGGRDRSQMWAEGSA